MVAGVERDGCGVDPLGRCFRRGRLAGCFPFTDTEIQPGTFEKFALLRISFQDGTKRGCGAREVVALKRLNAAFVDGAPPRKTPAFSEAAANSERAALDSACRSPPVASTLAPSSCELFSSGVPVV